MRYRWRAAGCVVGAALAVVSGEASARPRLASAAGVQIGSTQIIVTAPGGARVIVTRSPFGLRFVDAGGRTVLSEVAHAAAPLVIAPTPQAEFGTIGPAPPALYAPLSFLVGTQAVDQEPAGQWEGNLASVTDAGVEFSAQAVLAARQQGSSGVLTLSTDDPTGRRLVVRISAGPGNELRVSTQPLPATGVAAMSDSFGSPAGEAFHGFGGRHNSLDQRGSEFYNWIQQENVSSGSGSGITAVASPGGDTYMFPNGPQASYYVQSLFASTAGYGFLLSQNEISHWRMDSDRANAWQSEVGASSLDYTVVPGDAAQAVGGLTQTTGRQPVPPRWALGSLFDREVKYPSDPPAQYALEVQGDIDNIKRDHLRVDGYRIEGWQELSKPVLAHLIAELKALGIHPLVYFRAFVGQDSTGTDDPADYDYAIQHGYVATQPNGQPYTFISNFNANAAAIDFSNPAAVRWWQSRIKAALDLGADGFMQDFGEQVQTGMHFYNGDTGARMHNLLPVLYDRATREEVNAYERAHPRRQIFFFTRAGYSGAPGDAAYENANFPGDETTDFSRASGLASLTSDMLNRAIGGAFGYGADIGGYFDIGPYAATTEELFDRWAEWAALSPVFRLHGSLLAGVHTPWSYGQPTVKLYESLVALHLAARPLILKLWKQADRTGMPVTRPLWLQYPTDATAAKQDQEWLLGPNVLVAPVVTQGASSRSVYFPSGCWRSPVTGTTIRGPRSARVAASLDQLPYFFTCGIEPFRLAGSSPIARPSCPPATGRLSETTVGPVRLGETRSQLRRRLRQVSTRRRRNMDFFCLTPRGIRVGYPSSNLLRSLPGALARLVRGRAVLILSSNRRYSLRGVRPGVPASVLRRLTRARGYRIGRNTWYLLPGRASFGVFKVQRRVVEEVGIVDRLLTTSRAKAQRVLSSFS